MRNLLVASTILISCAAQAQTTTPSLSAAVLFDAAGLKTRQLIPIQISGSALTADAEVKAEVLDVDPRFCRVMNDPYMKSVYHLKCVVPAQTRIQFTVTAGGAKKTIVYGPLLITEYSPTYGAVGAPTPTPTPDPNDALARVGKQIWTTNCASCHTNANDKKGRTAAQIRAKINDTAVNNPMKSLTAITDADLSKIQLYLVQPDKY